MSHHYNNAIKPFKAQVMQGGRSNFLGYFATAEEAALAVARFHGRESSAQQVAAAAGRRRRRRRRRR